MEDEFLTARYELAVQAFDLVVYGGILMIYRARVWPAFYQLPVEEGRKIKMKPGYEDRHDNAAILIRQ